MKLVIGSDHAGYKTKQYLVKELEKKGYEIIDKGTHSEESVDYPDYAKKVAKQVIKEKCKGILVCGTGAGVNIAANKIKGIRAVQIYDKYSAKMAREHNHANIISVRGRNMARAKVLENILTFIRAQEDNHERIVRRIKKISRMEQ